MKTIVLDDDPTGTQSARNVTVLLESSADLLTGALREADSVYVQTNSRAIPEGDAVALVARVREDGLAAARTLGSAVQFVLRGDSTLRGHVFAETEVFAEPGAVLLFVPAFPAGGRTTLNGVHRVRVAGEDLPAHESEFAADPVFGFATGVLVDYVAEKSSRQGIAVPLDDVRAGRLPELLRDAPEGSVVLPDALDDDDILLIAAAVEQVRDGRTVVVRCAAPLAAALAGVASEGLLPRPLVAAPRPTLLVCGSHTAGATSQLALLEPAWGPPLTVCTGAALEDPSAAGHAVAGAARAQLEERGLALIASERARSPEHNRLHHGERVMAALTTAVRDLLPAVDVVVAKGGITSADVARAGLGARSAVVVGQVLPGVSVWEFDAADGSRIVYVVVPGNVGDDDTLSEVLAAVGYGASPGQVSAVPASRRT